MIESIVFALAVVLAPTPAPLTPYQFTAQDVICADGVCRVVARPVLRPVARIVTSPRSLPFFSFPAAAVHGSVGGTDAFTGSFSGGSVGSYAGGSVGSFSTTPTIRNIRTVETASFCWRQQNGQDRLQWQSTRRQSWAQRPGIFNWRWRVANRTNR